MKKLFTLFVMVAITCCIMAQSPQKMSYQAVIRNAANALVANHVVGMRISILQGSASGTVVYTETQTPTTNANGLVSIEIGGGTGFDAINWANDLYFLKTETDPTGGTNYTILGTSQLLSVPYALYSKTAQTTDYNNLTNLPNLSGYLTAESDPVFVSSPAHGITNGNITNWNTAFDWGNHAGLYRSISWVPAWTDVTGKPVFAKVATSGSYNDLIDKPITDGSETKVTAGLDITVTGVGTEANPYIINSTGGSGNITLSQVLLNGNDANGKNIKNLANPLDNGDAVTKAYVDALNQQVTALRNLLTGKGLNQLTDNDGNVYLPIKIGNQIWMSENLRTSKYNDGTPIPNVEDYDTWMALTEGAFCWYNNDQATYENTYGKLYNWAAVNTNKLCPIGWHVPSDADWTTLTTYLGGESISGGKLKTLSDWESPNTDATNAANFAALPGGARTITANGGWGLINKTGAFWSSSQEEPCLSPNPFDCLAFYLTIHYNDALATKVTYDNHMGLSVRCLKDN